MGGAPPCVSKNVYHLHMNILQSFQVCIKKSFTISGRASKSEFWWFLIIYVLYVLACYFLPYSFNGVLTDTTISLLFKGMMFIWLCMLIPLISVTIRRLHDVNKGGLDLFFILIPFIGFVLLWIWIGKKSDLLTNQYGPPPDKL